MNAPAPSSPVADLLNGRLIVSCQAPPGDPLRDTGTLVRLARAAAAGGAAGIRANEPEVIAAISAAVDLPLIGLWKDGDTGVYITPTVRHALAVAEAGAHVVAADATARPRPDGGTFADIVAAVHTAGALVMADVATFDEGVAAAAAGADFVSTTLSGYVPGSPSGRSRPGSGGRALRRAGRTGRRRRPYQHPRGGRAGARAGCAQRRRRHRDHRTHRADLAFREGTPPYVVPAPSPLRPYRTPHRRRDSTASPSGILE